MLKCKKCGHEWEARVAYPKTCPKCRCRNWSDYMKTIQPIKATEEGILNSETSGELIILMSYISSRAKKYASYLGKSEAAIGMTLHKLEHIGLIRINENGIKELNKEKLNEISKQIAINLCKDQYKREILRVTTQSTEKRKGRKSEVYSTLLGDLEDLSYNTKNSSLTNTLKEKQIKEIFETRQNFIRYLKERELKEIEKIEKMFEDHNFTEFLKIYLRLFFPSIKKKLSEVVQYYLKYGDIKIEIIRRKKK